MNQLKVRLLTLFTAAWHRRYAIIVPILVLPCIAFVVATMAPTQYRAHTSFLLQETAKMNPFLEDIAVSTMLKDRLSALKTLLKSRHVLTSVALEQQLINDSMSPQAIDNEIAKLAQNLSVTQLGKDFLKIELTSSTPDGMKALLESVSAHFVEELLAPERSSITDSSEFLTIHIARRKQQLEDAEQALAQFYNQHANSTPEMQSENLSRLAALKQTLAQKQAQLAGVEQSLGSLDQQLSQTNPIISKLEDQIIESRSQLALLQAKYTDSHSAVQAEIRKLEQLENERKQMMSTATPTSDSSTLWNNNRNKSAAELLKMQPLLITQLQGLQQARSLYESLKQETKVLADMIADLEKNSASYGYQAKRLQQLQRELTLQQQLYDELVQRYEMAQLTGSLGIFEQDKRVKVIDLPFTPSVPTNMPAILFVLMGIFAGAALGIGSAILLELLDSTLRRQGQIMAISKVPIITTIPKLPDSD